MRLLALIVSVLTLAACDSSSPDPVPADRTPPVVQITSPAAGARITGSFTVRYTATDPGLLPRIEVLLDGQVPVAGAPLEQGINSAQYSNGPHTLVVKVTDDAGNTGVSSVVTVTFAN